MTTARARDRGNVLAMKPDLAAPSGATCVDEWENVGAAFGVFDGPEWRITHVTGHGRRADIGDVVVSVIGRQYADGHAESRIIIDGPDTRGQVTPTEARKLGSALIAAAGRRRRVTCAPHPAYVASAECVTLRPSTRSCDWRRFFTPRGSSEMA